MSDVPIIARISGATIRMYFADHNPPHIHLIEGGHEAKIEIETGEVIAGVARAQTLRRVRRWMRENRESLLARWDEWT